MVVAKVPETAGGSQGRGGGERQGQSSPPKAVRGAPPRFSFVLIRRSGLCHPHPPQPVACCSPHPACFPRPTGTRLSIPFPPTRHRMLHSILSQTSSLGRSLRSLASAIQRITSALRYASTAHSLRPQRRRVKGRRSEPLMEPCTMARCIHRWSHGTLSLQTNRAAAGGSVDKAQ